MFSLCDTEHVLSLFLINFAFAIYAWFIQEGIRESVFFSYSRRASDPYCEMICHNTAIVATSDKIN